MYSIGTVKGKRQKEGVTQSLLFSPQILYQFFRVGFSCYSRRGDVINRGFDDKITNHNELFMWKFHEGMYKVNGLFKYQITLSKVKKKHPKSQQRKGCYLPSCAQKCKGNFGVKTMYFRFPPNHVHFYSKSTFKQHSLICERIPFIIWDYDRFPFVVETKLCKRNFISNIWGDERLITNHHDDAVARSQKSSQAEIDVLPFGPTIGLWRLWFSRRWLLSRF